MQGMAVAAYPIELDNKGVAYIEGASTKVIEVVQAKQSQEWTPEETQRELPHLTLAQVYAALAYYHANRAELDRKMRDRRRLADALRAQEQNPLTRAELQARRNPAA